MHEAATKLLHTMNAFDPLLHSVALQIIRICIGGGYIPCRLLRLESSWASKYIYNTATKVTRFKQNLART